MKPFRAMKQLIDNRGKARRQAEVYRAFDIGRGTYGTPEVRSWGEGATLVVGNFCSIANNVRIFLGGNHRPDWITTYPFSILWPAGSGIEGHPATKGDVRIGHDVWLGSGALILSGVTIGNGAVVGAGSVVSRDVRPYEIVAGNPAQHIRFRFSDETIAALQRIAWWNWPDHEIEAAFPLLLSGDAAAFVERYLDSDGR